MRRYLIPIILILLMCCQSNRFTCHNNRHSSGSSHHFPHRGPATLAYINSTTAAAAAAANDLRRQLINSAISNIDWISIRNGGPRLLQRLLLDESQVSPQSANQRAGSGGGGGGGGICIWNCPNKQNTTHLLLFSQTGTGEEPDARLTRYTGPQELKNSGFSPTRPTVLMVHGFRGSGLTHQTWAIDMKDLILARERSNVFFADWSHHARVISYIHALEHIAEVTEDLYSIFDNLEGAFPRFKMTDIHVIGHSLGSHIGGLLGQMMNRQLNQITALDPTGFLLNSAAANLKLSQDDAKYVSAFHTNAKYLGTEMNLADRDVFFNGGNDQPACRGITSSIIPGACSHRQAVKYASTFMNKCIMVAYLCKDYDTFLGGECGYCSSNSIACAGVGNEWQYAANSGPLRPQKSDKKKPKGDQPWIEGPTVPRYHLKMGVERPYCMFTYQVVVKFGDNSDNHLEGIRALDLVLRVSNRTLAHGVWVHLSNRLRPDARLDVFSGKGREKQTVSGRYLYTGLATVERNHELYDEMPVKFTEASLVRSVVASTTASGLAREQQLELQAPEVYVNFMSQPKFEARASKSGQIERVGYVNLEQANKSGREPRIESRMQADSEGGRLMGSSNKRQDVTRGWPVRWTQAARGEPHRRRLHRQQHL